MCGRCSGAYNTYLALREQLSSAAEQNKTSLSFTNYVKSILCDIVICGTGIDKDDTGNIINNLSSINGGLMTLIAQCSEEMSKIASSCPGPDHYKQTRER